MNIDDYRYIMTIAELGSFTAAANKLFIAQPSLSQRVKHIERTYGITIFTRGTKGSELTVEGECFVRYALQILQAEENLRNEILDMHDMGSAPVRMGIPQFIYSSFFNRLLSHIHEQLPTLQFDIIEGASPRLQEQLISNELDIAICYKPILYPELASETIYDDRFVLVPAEGSSLEKKLQAAAVPAMSSIDPKLLDGEAFAVGMPGTKSHRFLTLVEEEAGIQVKVKHQCKNFFALYRIAQSGIASAFVNESCFDELQGPKAYYYLDGISHDTLSAAMVWRKNTYLRTTAKRLVQLAHELRDDPGQV